jgi:Spy/CpxP family protein refolding chaperone
MKKIVFALAGLGIAAAAIPATANAAPLPGSGFGFGYGAQGGAWQNINARQARIEAKINQGVRSGALDRREASQLRAQFNAIASLERRYRMSRPGLTGAERADLDRRFDALERSIRIQKNDRDDRGHHGRRR